MSISGVSWDKPADDLLNQRDRFTRQAIREEFSQNPMANAIQFDSSADGFVTPVADNRYSVIWYRDPASQQATVHAVVPTCRFGGLVASDLKAWLAQILQTESKGKIFLK